MAHFDILRILLDKDKKDDYEDDYDDDDYYYDDDYEYDDDEYEDEDELPLEWEWETYQKSTHVYLPPPLPPSKSNAQQQPKTILHFIGGTLFGSYPLQFYKEFLEQIAEKSNSIVVATSIPVSFQSNPLNHYKLCYAIVKSFRGAYRDIICDEYGTKVVKEEMKIVGLGHSLGSRLHCIIATDDTDADDDDDDKRSDGGEGDMDERERRRRSRNRREKVLQKIALKREGNVLIAFNNYSAMSSVPGIKNLEKGVRQTRMEEREMKKRIEDQRKRSRQRNRRRSQEYDDEYDEYYDEDYYGNANNRRSRYDDDNYYDYFDDDEDDLELQDIVTSIKSSLTPNINKSSLEFQPSPDELWNKISDIYCKNVDKTLIVQFDNDMIDQSSKLAQEISDSFDLNTNINNSMDSMTNTTNTTNTIDSSTVKQEDKNVAESDSILFARLKGTHLNPVSYSDSFGLVQAWTRVSALPIDDLLKEAIDEDNRAFKGRNGKRKNTISSMKKNGLNDLTSSIARYITDIINQ